MSPKPPCMGMSRASRPGTSQATTQMTIVHLVASGFTLYKNRPVLKLTVCLSSEEIMFLEIMKTVLQIEEIKFLYLRCVLFGSFRISSSQ